MSESAPSAIRVEKVLIGLLPDLDSLTELVKEGLPAHVLPTEDLHPVYEWAVRYYGQSSKAPTPMALKERFGEDFFSDREIDLEDEPEESVEWAIETLKSNYIRTNAQRLAKDLVTSIRDASPEDRLEALNAFASEASAMALDLTPSVQVADLRESALDMVLVHDQRAELGDGVRGMAWGLEEIDAHYSGIHPGELAVLAAPSKMGKASPLTTPVLTPSGWSTIGALEEGDEVIGRDGHSTRVVQLHPIVDLPTYRVTLADGGTTVCSEQHLWTIQTADQRYTGTSMTIETAELAQRVGRGQTVYLPMVDPVQHPEADLPIHPYVMGVLIGDGSLTSTEVRVTKQDVDLHEKVAALHGQEPLYRRSPGKTLTSALRGLLPRVQSLGLGVISLHKFIPEQYLTASVQQRTDLLRGLMDSDGERLISPSGGGTTRYCTSSHRLAKDVQALVWSLGGSATIKAKVTTHAEHYRISIRMPRDFGCPFTTRRKVDLWERSQPQDGVGYRPTRRVVSVEPAGTRRVRCITVENEDGLYVTEDYIVTHNSFMLTWSALKNWEAGRPGILHTLENSRQMTEMRIACQALHLDYNALEQGKLSQEDRSTLLEWIEDVLLESDTPLIISSPDHRTPHSLIQQARAMEAQWVSVDQLNFVEPTRPRRDQNTPQELFQIMRDFKNLINGRHPLAMMIAHQIKREGIKNAEKTGWLTMTDMADSAGVERTADFVFGLYGSDDMRRSGGMQFQGLAARRAPLASYDLHWQPAIGGIAVRNEVDFDVSEYL